MRSTNYFAAFVLFLTPAIAVELLTGDTPLDAYLTPITFFILNVIYGGALLLLRETVVRWGKGFPSLLAIAAGYGMENEAIASKGFFDPHFCALDGLEGFGRLFGINVPWALNISIFHTVISMICPLVIVAAIFKDPRQWIGNKLYVGLLIVFVATSVFTFKIIALPPDFYHYDAGVGPILLVLTVMTALILLGWKMPDIQMRRWKLRIGIFTFFVFGAAYALAFCFLPNKIQATTGSPAAYVTFLLIAFVAVPIYLIFKMPEPHMRGKIAFVTGLFIPLLITSAGGGRYFAFLFVASLIVAAWIRNSPRELAS